MSEARRSTEICRPGPVRTAGAALALSADGRVATLLALLALALFVPALSYGFVEWDDDRNFLFNPHYRGLGLDHIGWMFSSAHTGHWIPITWLTLGFDYVLWGLNPAGYHLTSVLIHSANAALFFLLAVHLLTLAIPSSPAAAVRIGAAAATLIFALHPLRVESVVWVTERRDVLSALFSLVVVQAYLRVHSADSRHPGRWRLVSILAFQLAIMSKSIVVSLPLVLLLLDAYPLNRIGWRRWRELRAAITEKIPYFLLAGMGALAAVTAARVNDIFTPLEAIAVTERLGLVAYSLWFYLSRTLAPVGLSPLHGLPPSLDLWQPRFFVSVVAVALLVAAAIRWRSRWPGLTAALLAYALILAPVSGILHNGVQIVAERYSYLSCMPWALLMGGAVCLLAGKGWPLARTGRALAATGIAGWLVVVTLATMTQLAVWRDTESLWRAALAADPECSICHHEYGVYLRANGNAERALGHIVYAVALRPTSSAVERYLAQAILIYDAAGQMEKAHEELKVLATWSPEAADVVARAIVPSW